jgi:hypothetical protein
MVEFASLAHDAWIKANSDIEAQKLHMLGVVTFRWNLCEQKLLAIFANLLERGIGETHILAHQVGNVGLMNRIRLLAKVRVTDDNSLVATINNALDVCDICRQNRNQLTHFNLVLASRKNRPRSGFTLARRNRSPEFRKSEPFPDTVQDIRRVARDIRRLNVQLYKIERRLFKRFNSTASLLTAPPPKDRLPLPRLLWPQNVKDKDAGK